MSNRDCQWIDTGFIATGKRQRGNNYSTNNEVEDDFLNTQGENSPISTQPNLNFAQQPSPMHLSISSSRREERQLICASMEKKSNRTAIHNEEFSVSAAVKTFEQLQGFSKEDTVLAMTIFINNAGVREAFLSCNEETRAPLIKAIIDQHKPKQKLLREELEQDADQNQPKQKPLREELEQDADQNQNALKRQWEEHALDADQNQSQSSRMRATRSFISNRQCYIEEVVPTLQSQPLRSEDMPRHKLVFANQIPQSIYASNKITDKDNKPIQIQVRDINTGRQCTNVDIKVKIVVIDGDLELEGLDSDEFTSKIVKQREGKRPLLYGNTEVTFNQQGIGTVGDICFTDNSKWLRSGKFRLGACIDSKRSGTNIKILEGLSEKFVVKDHRGLSYMKHYPPMLNLNDDIWRLENIARDGKYHQRLKDKNIKSVQDFLKLWNENPIVLKEILKMPTNFFKKVVKHAQMCPMELNNAKFENNADLQKIPGLEPNPMPVPNAGLLHAPESQAQYMGMGKQRDPAAYFGNNGSSEAVEEMPQQPSTGQDINHGLESGTLPNPMPEFQPRNMAWSNKWLLSQTHLSMETINQVPLLQNVKKGPNSSNLHADENFKGMLEDTTEIPDLAGLEIPDLPLLESSQWDDEFDFSAFLDGGSTSN